MIQFSTQPQITIRPSMLHKNPITTENELAQKMLEEAVNNKKIKRALIEISTILISQTLEPIKKELESVTQFSALPKEFREMLENLAAEHSAEKRQYGALMAEEFASAQAILSSMSNIYRLINAQEAYLKNIDAIKTVDEMVVALKIIIELGYTYYEASIWHQDEKRFNSINTFISPTREEIDIRVFRSELKEPSQLALTHGIGKTEQDLGLESLGKGYNAGKAAFSVVNMKKRLELLCKTYDSTKSEKATAQMANYKIPLDKNERKPLESYAKQWETFFEKLAKDPKTKESLPLIASVSRATTRVLVSLQYLNALNKENGSFDFDKAQIIANCLMGFIVHAGHHSIVEVAEVYNRLLDLVLIEQVEQQTSKTASPSKKQIKSDQLANFPEHLDEKGFADKKPPAIPEVAVSPGSAAPETTKKWWEGTVEYETPYYYHVGNYCSFFHTSYRTFAEHIIKEANDVNCAIKPK